ncbi:hypothetical protein [Mesorhizobium sp. KR9-304]|uniref:hypothetical protein n=1 Tax=Mesorhizobium sp. KR9-304 TaxID=3156614 RepID=UPI0032B503A4
MAVDNEEDLLQRFAAMQDMRVVSKREFDIAPSAVIPASRLIAYASREAGIADLDIERLIREQPRARAIYFDALRTSASSFSSMAVAAGTGGVRNRLVGPHRVELVDEADMTYLVVYLGESTDPVEWIEVRTREGGGGRIRLGRAIRNVVQLPLDHRRDDMRAIDEGIRQPDSEIYLLP